MKTTILFFIALLGFYFINAQNTDLIIFTEQGEPFYLVLNGIKQNASPETNVKVTDLNADAYKAKIIFENQNIPQLDKNIYFQSRGNQYTFNVKQNKKGIYVMRFISEVPLAQALPPSPTQTVIVYSATPPVATTTTTTTTTNVGTNAAGVSMGVHVNDPDLGVNFNMDINTGGGNTGNATYSETTTTTTGNTAVVTNQPVIYVPGYSGPVGCPVPMMPQDFENAKNTIASKSFDDTKLAIAKQIVNSNCLTSAQVRDLLNQFDFEDTKLDLAKYCYGYTYDLGNYYTVNDAFDFESTIDELNEYILQNPR